MNTTKKKDVSLVSFLRPRALARGVSVLALLAATGCAVTPEPLTQADVAARVAADRSVLFSKQEPITGPITLEEAIGRALKYNLDRRLAVMDAALQQRQLDLSGYDMLPRLAASAGYIARSNESLSLSRQLDGTIGTEPSTSQDPQRSVAELGLSWNILDFGVSYYQARQQADRSLIAEERRRRVVHSVVQQVRTAYWQAVAAERVRGRLGPVLADARRALEDARAVERQRLRPAADVLRYQKGVVEVLRQLEALQQEEAIAKAQLAALMNLPPGQPFQVAVPAQGVLPVPEVRLGLEEMETVALNSRPELREEQYQSRVTAAEARKAVLRMLPGLTLAGSYNYDSNGFLVNQQWFEASTRVTWNLLNLLSGPAAMRVQEAQAELGETRRLALSMAALTQVHVGYQQLARAREQYDRAVLLNDIEQRLFEVVRQQEAGDAQSPLERVRQAASALTAELQRDRAYGEVQAALANLYVSLGVDPLPAEVASHDLPALVEAIRSVSNDWQSGRVKVPAAPTAEAPAAAAVPVAEAPEAEPPAAAPVAAAPAAVPAPAAAAPVAAVAPKAVTPAPAARQVAAAQDRRAERSREERRATLTAN
jgi:outer membrane protein TolC